MNAAAVVLCKTVTGLATIRALGNAGVDVHCVLLEPNDPVRLSRHGRKVDLVGTDDSDPALIEFLLEYARKLGNRPVVFPTSDAQVLQLAMNADRLQPVCRIPANSHASLLSIIRKDGLYRAASDAGVSTIPSIVSDNPADILSWSRTHPAPYLLKPFYEGFSGAALPRKNLVVNNEQELADYIAANGTRGVIVQRLLRGGDGFIFDCYGLCARDGSVLTMVSHRRWRQYPPDFGTTTLGEIPAGLDAAEQSALFDATEKLLRSVRYHGIFGIEWLRERSSGRFYLIDFNARPFTTIGHVEVCGLNLPLLHYLEMTGSIPVVAPRPELKRILWVDLWRDMSSYQEKQQRGELSFPEWTASIRRCRKLAYFRLSDPLPGLDRYWVMGLRLARFALRHATRRLSGR